ncbi:hypothetical protein EYF80_048314 [Liparis tanakae]|uniref:Uncharacterized protein n=1 Tax=Liparis tanakae TaxID=230148 RepID=A0A4Z2FK35_9TELE|nr:hypothetical protein EYF80_048314 [Liparis tanakae]
MVKIERLHVDASEGAAPRPRRAAGGPWLWERRDARVICCCLSNSSGQLHPPFTATACHEDTYIMRNNSELIVTLDGGSSPSGDKKDK